MRTVLILLSLVLTLSIITACGESIDVTPQDQTKTGSVANQIPVTLTESVKLTDTTTTANIKIDYKGTGDYTFTNFSVIGSFDVKSDDCIIDDKAKTLKTKAGGCTLNVKAGTKAPAAAIEPNKNNVGAVIFGSTTVPLIGSGAGAPKMVALKPYKPTSSVNKYTNFTYVPIGGVAINDNYTVTVPKNTAGEDIVRYFNRGESEQYCTTEESIDNTTTYKINNPNFRFNPQWITCSFVVRAMEPKDVKSFTAVVTVKHNDNTTEYLYTYNTFDRVYPDTDIYSFPDTAVTTKSEKSALIYFPPRPYGPYLPPAESWINSYVTFKTDFFKNFKINTEWTTCKSILPIENIKQDTDPNGCALVIDFIPSQTGEIKSSIERELRYQQDTYNTTSTETFKGNGI